MKIGVLTSSRADFGIYLPLLRKLKEDDFFHLEIIAFGTHLSACHGFTLREIEKEAFPVVHCISSLLSNDDEQSIASSYGLTALKFAEFWAIHQYDLVFCLGDRFEMSAAVQAGIPFNVKFAHLHGGETTLGAIDNVYRDQITLASHLHFTAAKEFSDKVTAVKGSPDGVFTVGSLSLEGIHQFKPFSKEVFFNRFSIPRTDFALITFHPETLNNDRNIRYAKEMKEALLEISKILFLVVTMPNADTSGSIFRKEIESLAKNLPNKMFCIENFGKKNYFSAMSYASLLIGNTSSGILEAASFGKYVVNVGERQKGRLQSENVFNAKFCKEDIVSKVHLALSQGSYEGLNLYYKEKTADLIIEKTKLFYAVL